MTLTRKTIFFRRLAIALPAFTLYFVGRSFQDENLFLAGIFAFLIGVSITQIEKVLRK
jgi:hypothetical protein